MPTAKKKKSASATRASVNTTQAYNADRVVGILKRLGSTKIRDGMPRYGLPPDKAFGVSVGALRKLAKQIGSNHSLASDLWRTGWYEARMLAIFIEEPPAVTAAQMDRWCRDFDNWGLCDTACFHLFDRLPHAVRKVEQWSRLRGEFQKRTAFALLACLALHRKDLDDDIFLRLLPLIEDCATDERNFVCKAVNWALRSIGERNTTLHAAAMKTAQRLAESSDATARWTGKDAVRQLRSAAVTRRLANRAGKSARAG